jgi:hypothetical protein
MEAAANRADLGHDPEKRIPVSEEIMHSETKTKNMISQRWIIFQGMRSRL